MITAEIEKRLKDVMAVVLEVTPDEINEDSSQHNMESWESLRQLDLVVAVEEEFGITIPLEQVADMTSFSNIKNIVEQLC